MKNFIKILSCILLFGLHLSGCETKSTVIQSIPNPETEKNQQSDRDGGAKEMGQDAKAEVSGEPDTEPALLYVYVCGAVKKPGVYQLPAGSRVFQALDIAGGFTEAAAQTAINLADQLKDGQQLRILTQEEVSAGAAETLPADAKGVLESAGAKGETAGAAAKIDINQADTAKLCELNGIGQLKALEIIRYREENGPFASVEELKNVNGIGEKTYEKIKDNITVN